MLVVSNPTYTDPETGQSVGGNIVFKKPVEKLTLRKASAKKGPIFTINDYQLQLQNYKPGQSKWKFDGKVKEWEHPEDVTALRGWFFLVLLFHVLSS
jgi:hypothetical protein